MNVLLDMSGAPLETSNEVAPHGEARKVTNEGFFRGDSCNFHPNFADLARDNFCEHFLLKGFIPDVPIIAKTSRITAFGSCFAHNIAAHLVKRGFDLSQQRAPEIHISTIGEGLVNVHSILSQFRWALEDGSPRRASGTVPTRACSAPTKTCARKRAKCF